MKYDMWILRILSQGVVAVCLVMGIYGGCCMFGLGNWDQEGLFFPEYFFVIEQVINISEIDLAGIS